MLHLPYWPLKSGEKRTEGQAHSKCRSGAIPELPGQNPVPWALGWLCWSRRLDQVTHSDPFQSDPCPLKSAKHHFQWAPHFDLSDGRSLPCMLWHLGWEKPPWSVFYVLVSVIHGRIPVLKWLQHAVDAISNLLSWIVYIRSMEAKGEKYHNGKLQLADVTPRQGDKWGVSALPWRVKKAGLLRALQCRTLLLWLTSFSGLNSYHHILPESLLLRSGLWNNPAFLKLLFQCAKLTNTARTLESALGLLGLVFGQEQWI